MAWGSSKRADSWSALLRGRDLPLGKQTGRPGVSAVLGLKFEPQNKISMFICNLQVQKRKQKLYAESSHHPIVEQETNENRSWLNVMINHYRTYQYIIA